jgi:high-affinity iron transporter
MDDLRLRTVFAYTLLAVLLGSPAALGATVAATPADEARRLLTLLRGVGEEYREALDADGRLVRPLEIEEARLLIAEARDHAGRLGGATAGELTAGLDGLAAALGSTAPLATVEALVDTLRRTVTTATGVVEDFLPGAPPSPVRGQAVYAAHCVSCHGERGAGDGADASGLERKPADFSDASFMRAETPSDFFTVVSVGRRRAAMPAWGDVLSVQERWDVISYVRGLATSSAALAQGRGLYLAHCAGCHGETADGRGPFASTLPTPVPDLRTPAALVRRADADLFAVVTDGVGTAMPGFARSLSDEERWNVVAFLRTASLDTSTGLAPDTQARSGAPAAGVALAEVRRLLAAAVAAYAKGDPAASQLATDAYLAFEPVEPALGARHPDLVLRVEEAFLRFRLALREPGGQAAALADAVRQELTAAEAALGSPADAWARFVQSAAIILREGFEVVLILGALIAYVVKSGNAAMKRSIYGGAGLGMAASVATAVLLVTVFRLTPGAAEVLEGAAMLLAACVLFWVSYWIISKAEAERWQRYIQGKVKRALAEGSGTALAAAAFLAVYREGFETVLFYQALLAGAPAGDVLIPLGFVVGVALLAVVYVVFNRFGLRLPIRPFFLATGAFLYYLAVVFAGQGVRELQEAGVVGMTPVAWAPEIAFLGLFPTVETLAAQGVLLLLLAYALGVTLRRRQAHAEAEHETLRAEVRRLRELAETLRAEVVAMQAIEGAALGARLDGLLVQVAALEKRVGGTNGRT